MNLGFFTMPLHPPGRNYIETLKEDREAIIMADRLGFTEAYVGEHTTDLAETIPGYDATSWYGLMVPANTPQPIMQRLHAEISKIMQSPDVKQRYAQLGVDPVASTPEQFKAYIQSETAKWAEVVKRSGAKVD